MTDSISLAEARRLALTAQGFDQPRPGGRIDRRHMRRVMQRLKLIQLDSIPIVLRTQYLPFFSRLGPYRAALLDELAYRDDEWFELWSHEASLAPVVDEPLFRWRKARAAAGDMWRHLHSFLTKEAGYVAEVLAEVLARGPLTAAELSNPRPQQGDWWANRSLGSVALDVLFRIGHLGVRRGPNFDKRYDALDRIVPRAVLDQPTPQEEDAHRALLLRAADAFGVGTANCLIDYYRLPKVPARLRLAELVESGRLLRLRAEGTSQPVYALAAAKRPRPLSARALISPFDPLVWNRARALWLWSFDYRIEIYTPAAKRVYGYYVLPFLQGDRLVARVDLKTDRQAGVLRAQGSFAEPGTDHEEIATDLATELTALAAMVGVERIAIGRRGNLSSLLRARLAHSYS